MHEKPLILTRAPRAPLEALDPRVKLAAAVVWAVCIVSTPPGRYGLLAAYAGLLAVLLATNARLLGKFARRVAPALPGIVLLVLLLPWFKAGAPVWQIGGLAVSREGLAVAARVGAVAVLCVAAIGLVWASTTHEHLLLGLRGLHVPAIFVGIVGFMLRYLDVLRPELHRLTDARAARTIGPGGPGRLRCGANIVGTLFLRAHARAERVADAMAARGYAGQLRTFQHAHAHRRDVLAATGFGIVVIGLRLMLGGG